MGIGVKREIEFTIKVAHDLIKLIAHGSPQSVKNL
jgi:hypothetical protein